MILARMDVGELLMRARLLDTTQDCGTMGPDSFPPPALQESSYLLSLVRVGLVGSQLVYITYSTCSYTMTTQ